MLPAFLLLFTVWLDEGLAICFRNESARVKRVKVGIPAAVDEYHCKIMCAEMNECLAYLFTDYDCFLLGTTYTDSSTCILPYYEWVKKRVDEDCPTSDYFAQPQIETGYVQDSAIAGAIAASAGFNLSSNSCPKNSFTAFTHPDNSHLVQGNFGSIITWDGALGSWRAVMRRGQYVEKQYKNVTACIRGARCFMVNCTQFSDMTRCGGIIPIITDIDPKNDIVGPIQSYGKLDVCNSIHLHFGFFSDFWSKVMDYASDESCIACIDGQWIFPTGINAVYTISHAVCRKAAGYVLP